MKTNKAAFKSTMSGRLFLLFLFILVLCMISLGGVTRLTRSGLSIVEWKPVSGVLPPLNESQWQLQFELYQKSPEYLQINNHFQIEDYKKIFFWEYLHRLLGRIIFVVSCCVGFFLWRRHSLKFKHALLLPLLVLSQGLIGWLMVRSGLNSRPHVSHYMLAMHFFAALLLIYMIVWIYFQLFRNEKIRILPKQRSLFFLTGLFLFLQIFWGNLVSGLKAGYYYNSYPLMYGRFFPADGFNLQPLFLNFFENPATVQWVHRWLGILLFTVISLLAVGFLKNKKKTGIEPDMYKLFAIALIQLVLGVSTLVLSIPIYLAVFHQVVATLLVSQYFVLSRKIQI